ncbi:hypothetical protein PHISP_02917 [Aspergillus sp. HF37]|nr:hypothetical protein PHISP_02917 [Aspergillus sp. HF37]
MRSNNIFPAVLAIGLGVFTGYYTFQPSLKQLQSDKATKAEQDRISAENAHKDPSASPVTVQDPGAPSRQRWTERIWGSKKTAEAAGPGDAPATGNNPRDGQQ